MTDMINLIAGARDAKGRAPTMDVSFPCDPARPAAFTEMDARINDPAFADAAWRSMIAGSLAAWGACGR